MSDAILVVDDDAGALRALGAWFEQQGAEVARELDGAGALAACDRIEPDVAILDLGVAPVEGKDLIGLLSERGVPVIVLADDPAAAAAVEAWKRGAALVLPRQADPAPIGAAAGRLAEARRRRRAAEAALAAPPDLTLEGLGGSPALRAVAQQVAALAQSDRTTVLIMGEHGVGKAWVARLIHELGPRAREPFLESWCGGQDAVRLESALVGHERGGVPDARRRVRGLLELAGRGTLLLREIGALPVELQPILLRVLEGRTFRRVGGQRDVPAEARLIATTCRNLADEVEANAFRGDLYYRLSTMVLSLPALRDRSEAERSALVQGQYAALARRLPEPPPPMAPETHERLVQHHWPGNLRELIQVLERSALVARGQPALLVEHLPGELRARPGLGDRRHTPMSLEEIEKQHIERSLRFHGGNRTRAAKELRISRATLINKIKRYAITD